VNGGDTFQVAAIDAFLPNRFQSSHEIFLKPRKLIRSDAMS